MSGSVIDLFKPTFWVAVVLAMVILVPIVAPALRKRALALVNLGFIALLLKADAVSVLAGAAVAYLILKLAEGGRLRDLAGVIGTFGALALLVLHKLPEASHAFGLHRLNPITTAIGFSYVALRMLDALRSVHEGRSPAPDLPATINYLFPFHALAAGPIQAYDDFASQPPVPPPLDAADALGAFERIASGLFKKYVLAISIERVFLTHFREPGVYSLLEVQMNFLWLYLDFSAYSDIAVGIGRLIGVATPENFKRPYLARNLIEFWERWHISLSLFIRRNVFIPLQLALARLSGGTRPLLVSAASFTVAFVLCGLWHEISVRYLIWGALQALGLIVCNLYRSYLLKTLGRKGVDRYLKNPLMRTLGIVITFEYEAFALVVVTSNLAY